VQLTSGQKIQFVEVQWQLDNNDLHVRILLLYVCKLPVSVAMAEIEQPPYSSEIVKKNEKQTKKRKRK